MQVSLGASSCSLAGESVGAAGGEGPSEGARPRDPAQAGTRVDLAAPFEDLLSLEPLMTPSKRLTAGRWMISLASPCEGNSYASPTLWELTVSGLSCYLFSPGFIVN